MMMIRFCSLLLTAFILSCAGGRLYLNESGGPHIHTIAGDDHPDYTIYVVGDGGEINTQSKVVMQKLGKLIADDLHPGMVLFVGDNIYHAGMPPASDVEAHLHAQDILMNQIAPVSSYHGEIIFIPGNHDWNEFKEGGLASIRRQGDFLNKLGARNIRMLPENGCGGPVTLHLNDHIVMIIVDSQWWLQDWTKEPSMNADCGIKTREEFIHSFRQAVDANRDKRVIVTLHHPLYSQGGHGGHFTVRDHLFPLSKLVKWLYLPLPVIGSIYPYYRSVFGHPQDIKHPRYRALKEALLEAVGDKNDIIFLAGHDHNLQYVRKDGQHFLLSGSIAKQNPVANAKHLVYGHKAAGFMQVDFYNDQGVLLSVYEIDVEREEYKVVYSRFIINTVTP